MDCIFCKIIKGEIPSYKIYEDDYTYAFLDISKEGYGHTLVVPKKHFASFLECSKFYMQKCMDAVKKIGNHFITNCGFTGFNVIINTKESAGQSIMHLHIHIIPRKEGDGLGLWQINKDKTDLKKVCKMLEVK